MRIADFNVDVPLADIDDDSSDPQSIIDSYYHHQPPSADLRGVFGLIESLDEANNNSPKDSESFQSKRQQQNGNEGKEVANSPSPDTETTFSETLGGSLEDLVSHFDQQISSCFKDLTERTETIAPVQMRTQEEIMNESQIWWTLTGNFGNILPIDWSKSYARKLQLPALRLRSKEEENDDISPSANDLDVSDDEELAQALDLHSLIASQMSPLDPPPQTADEVIEEIDEIFMQQSYNSEWTGCSDLTGDSIDSFCHSINSANKSPMTASVTSQNGNSNLSLDERVEEMARLASSGRNLWNMSYKDLVSVHSELETLIKIYNETLVQELAMRDELEYDKEIKNAFISTLTSVQNKRRQWNMERKRKSSDGKTSIFMNGESLPQFLTAIIPYDDENGPMDNDHLERLIKILRAVDENNPNVPAILTDYILNVVCPSTTGSLCLSSW